MISAKKSLPQFYSYVVNSKFGNYYLPARFQYVILRDYYSKFKKNFILPQGEPVFSNTKIRLRTIIKNLKKGDGLVLISIHMLPTIKRDRKKIYEDLIKKKIQLHCVFEGLIIKNRKDLKKIEDIITLNKFTDVD